MSCEVTPNSERLQGRDQVPTHRVPDPVYVPNIPRDTNGRPIPVSEEEKKMAEYIKDIDEKYRLVKMQKEQLESVMLGTHKRKFAKTESLKLPEFGGDRAAYQAWKLNFQSIIDKLDIPEDFKGTYLYNSLTGSAK